MKLVVESGATKSTWVILDDDKVLNRQILSGINPTANPESLSEIEAYSNRYSSSVNEVFFYGAGVSSGTAHSNLNRALRKHFKTAQVEIASDMLAAARSVSDGQVSIVSILGTGMNSVIFDGKVIIDSHRSLGYLFGDYGSGFYIGKLLLQSYYRDKMEKDDAMLFENLYVKSRDDLIYRIYNAPKPNYEVAQLSRFLTKCSKGLKQSILHTAFSDFFVNEILTFDNHESYPLNFVGSISEIFEQELKTTADKYCLQVDHVVGNPIEGLLAYHRKKK